MAWSNVGSLSSSRTVDGYCTMVPMKVMYSDSSYSGILVPVCLDKNGSNNFMAVVGSSYCHTGSALDYSQSICGAFAYVNPHEENAALGVTTYSGSPLLRPPTSPHGPYLPGLKATSAGIAAGTVAVYGMSSPKTSISLPSDSGGYSEVALETTNSLCCFTFDETGIRVCFHASADGIHHPACSSGVGIARLAATGFYSANIPANYIEFE